MSVEYSTAETLKRTIHIRRQQLLETWHERSLTLEELHDNANLIQMEKSLGGDHMGRQERQDPKQNQEETQKDSSGVPAIETFSRKEINRMVEVRTNSSEQENNAKGNGKNKMNMVSQGIRREIRSLLGIRIPKLQVNLPGRVVLRRG